MRNELENFNEMWEREAGRTVKLLEALPRDKYDFRPDPEGRSLGELAWHLAEIEAYGSFGIERGAVAPEPKPPGIERPRAIAELAPGYERVHRAAFERVKKVTGDDLDRPITLPSGKPITIRNVLWDFILLHGLHHRGQLVMLIRQAGGKPIGLYGPTRETMPLPKPRA